MPSSGFSYYGSAKFKGWQKHKKQEEARKALAAHFRALTK